MLAQSLARRLTAQQLCLTDRELDIGDRAGVLAYAERERPELIINAAAYTRVDDAEREPALAFRVNADGPAHLAEAAQRVNARLLHFSTDYIFSGEAQQPYVEAAPSGPLGVYGRSKLLGEQRVMQLLPNAAFVLRTSWLFGKDGPNFVTTMLELLRTRDELRVVDDQHGRPTYAEDLSAASLALVGVSPAAVTAAPGVYHFANAGITSWYRFCCTICEVCRALGEEPRTQRIIPVTTREFARPAPRPAYSVLDTNKIEATLDLTPRSYREALVDYLQEVLALHPRPNGRS